jgi:hypothetical protein
VLAAQEEAKNEELRVAIFETVVRENSHRFNFSSTIIPRYNFLLLGRPLLKALSNPTVL